MHTMKLKIIYIKNIDSLDNYILDEFNYYIITQDNWDDYLYKTSFNVTIIKNNSVLEKVKIKILFRGQTKKSPSYKIINDLMGNRNDIEIKAISDKIDFISMNDHYEELRDIFNDNDLYFLLEELNDINYLKKYNKKKNLLPIIKEEGFELSLLRDQYAKRVFSQGIDTLLYSKTIPSDKYYFNFKFKLEDRDYNYKFNFSDSELPSRINILIGKNGVGKSKTLEMLVNYLINPKQSKATSSPHPDFLSNLCVFSYNPYDNFYIYKPKDN